MVAGGAAGRMRVMRLVDCVRLAEVAGVGRGAVGAPEADWRRRAERRADWMSAGVFMRIRRAAMANSVSVLSSTAGMWWVDGTVALSVVPVGLERRRARAWMAATRSASSSDMVKNYSWRWPRR